MCDPQPEDWPAASWTTSSLRTGQRCTQPLGWPAALIPPCAASEARDEAMRPIGEVPNKICSPQKANIALPRPKTKIAISGLQRPPRSDLRSSGPPFWGVPCNFYFMKFFVWRPPSPPNGHSGASVCPGGRRPRPRGRPHPPYVTRGVPGVARAKFRVGGLDGLAVHL